MFVSAAIADRDLGSVVGDLGERDCGAGLAEGFSIEFGGEYEEQQETFRALFLASVLALILVYMVMAAQFESLRDPFLILFSVPLAAIGVVLMLLITDTTFNQQAFLGIIVLLGIVVNNAIVLVDYTNLLRRQHGSGAAPRRSDRRHASHASDPDDHDYDRARSRTDGVGYR